MAGALLTFARSIGEIGSVIVLSGNIPNKTLTAPVFIYNLAAQFKPEQAAAVAALPVQPLVHPGAGHRAAQPAQGGLLVSAPATVVTPPTRDVEPTRPPQDRRRGWVRGGAARARTGLSLRAVAAPARGDRVDRAQPRVVDRRRRRSRRADVLHAFQLTLIITVITVVVTTVFGVIVAWVLVRQPFRGSGILNALVDLPLALSPVTVGLACVLLFGRGGWFEPFFAARGIQIIFALPSMVLVTIFISIPFVIRGVQPVLVEIGTEEEDAARTLGASVWRSFRRVTLPNIRWGLLYGVALSAARAIGEIGAVLVVSGLIQGKTETATLYIFRAVEDRDTASGYIVALTLAAVSILILIGIETFKRRSKGRRRYDDPRSLSRN